MQKINIKPFFSEINSLNDINISSKISANTELKVPLSFINDINDDDAINIALSGSIGFIHDNCTIDQQISMIYNVKNYINYILRNPFSIRQNVNIANLNNIFEEKEIDCLLVSNVNNELIGIVTKSDLEFANLLNNPMKNVSDIMTPYNEVTYTNNLDISIDDALFIIASKKVKYLPVIDYNNVIKGLITLKTIRKYNNINNNINIISDTKNRLKCGAHITIKDDDSFIRFEKLLKTDVDVIIINHFHAHNKWFINKIRDFFKKNLLYRNKDIIVGSVFTNNAIETFSNFNISGFLAYFEDIDNLNLEVLYSCIRECRKINKPISIYIKNEVNIKNIFKYLLIGFSCFITNNSNITDKYVTSFSDNIKKEMYMINCSSIKKLNEIKLKF